MTSLESLHLGKLRLQKRIERDEFLEEDDIGCSLTQISDTWFQHFRTNVALAEDLTYIFSHTHYQNQQSYVLVKGILLDLLASESVSLVSVMNALKTQCETLIEVLNTLSQLLSDKLQQITAGDDLQARKVAQILTIIASYCRTDAELYLLLSSKFDSKTVIQDEIIDVYDLDFTLFNQNYKGTVGLVIAKCLQSKNNQTRLAAFDLTCSLATHSHQLAKRMMSLLVQGLLYEVPENRCFILANVVDLCRKFRLNEIATHYLIPLLATHDLKLKIVAIIGCTSLLLQDAFENEVESVIARLAQLAIKTAENNLEISRDQKTSPHWKDDVKLFDNSRKIIIHFFEQYSQNRSAHQQELSNSVIWLVLTGIVSKKAILDSNGKLCLSDELKAIVTCLYQYINDEYQQVLLKGLFENLKESMDVEIVLEPLI
ncbi:hypothetical protein RCL1_008337 [Eukaryota sp. TZLM3-RCL]